MADLSLASDLGSHWNSPGSTVIKWALSASERMSAGVTVVICISGTAAVRRSFCATPSSWEV